jgi:hypothetical protein
LKPNPPHFSSPAWLADDWLLPERPRGKQYKAGDNLLSRWTHYHRPQVLIGRVRDGNGSFHLGMVTGSSVPSDPNRVLANREEGVYQM